MLKEKCESTASLSLNENIVLFGSDRFFKSDDTFDLILLLAKLFIYKCKINKDIPLLKQYIYILSEVQI